MVTTPVPVSIVQICCNYFPVQDTKGMMSFVLLFLEKLCSLSKSMDCLGWGGGVVNCGWPSFGHVL